MQVVAVPGDGPVVISTALVEHAQFAKTGNGLRGVRSGFYELLEQVEGHGECARLAIGDGQAKLGSIAARIRRGQYFCQGLVVVQSRPGRTSEPQGIGQPEAGIQLECSIFDAFVRGLKGLFGLAELALVVEVKGQFQIGTIGLGRSAKALVQASKGPAGSVYAPQKQVDATAQQQGAGGLGGPGCDDLLE